MNLNQSSVMKTPIRHSPMYALSAASFALIASGAWAAAQDAEPVPAGQSETAPKTENGTPPIVPETGLGGPRAVDLDPEFVGAGDSEDAPPKTDLTVMDIVAGSEDFTVLVTALKAAGLDDNLQTPGPFTLFAPNNKAFGALPEGVLKVLMLPENTKILNSILSYHVIPQKLRAAEIAPGELKTAQGETVLLVANDEGKYTLQGANILRSDVTGKNGVIHVVDKVLLPPTIDIVGLVKPPAAE